MIRSGAPATGARGDHQTATSAPSSQRASDDDAALAAGSVFATFGFAAAARRRAGGRASAKPRARDRVTRAAGATRRADLIDELIDRENTTDQHAVHSPPAFWAIIAA